MYGIFTYIYHKNQPNVGVYTSPMDPMGYAYTHQPQPWGQRPSSRRLWGRDLGEELVAASFQGSHLAAMEAAARKDVTGMSQELRIKG